MICLKVWKTYGRREYIRTLFSLLLCYGTKNTNVPTSYTSSNPIWLAIDPNTSIVRYSNSMVSNTEMLEHWFLISEPYNIEYTNDISSIPIALDTQLNSSREIFTQWKHHRNITIYEIKPYITRTFRIFHQYSLEDFYTWLKTTWAFELWFLCEHNGSDPSAYYPVCCPLYSPHSSKTFPTKIFLFPLPRHEG